MNNDIRTKVLNFLSERNEKKATLDKLTTAIKSKELKDTLAKMVQKGEIIFNGKAYKYNSEKPKEGRVQINKMGIKFIQVNGKKMVPINTGSFYYVLDGDTVTYHVINNEAYVCEVIKRRLNARPFEVIFRDGKKALEYTNGKFCFNSKNIDLTDYAVGEVLLIDIINFKIIKRISNKSNPNNRDIIIAYNHGFDDYYSPQYFKELDEMKKEVTEEDIIGRVDFRNENVFTIDCKNTGDIDDAVSVKRLDNGNYLLCVHIASISEYVPFLGEIFQTAMKRGTSAYSQRSVFPQYHPIISDGVCSLRPGIDRLTKTIMLEIDNVGNVVNRKLCFSVINSKKKMEYEEVDKVYTDAPDMDPSYLPFVNDLKLFREITDIMGSHLISHGKVELANDKDVRVIFDEDNIATGLTGLDGPLSRKSIEYAMIYANWQWALELSSHNIPMIYRNHLEKDSIDKSITRLKNAGFDTSILERSGSIQAFLKTVQNNPMDYKIASEIILSSGLNSAFFANTNEGHFGIGLPLYGFFSSGIRRGADTFNHYSTDAYLRNDRKIIEKLEYLAADYCDLLNFRETAGEEFEKESLQCELLEIATKDIGYEFLGIISAIRNGQAYVRLDNGLYGIFEAYYAGKNVCVGDRINVRIDSINLNTKEINLSFVNYVYSRKNNGRAKTKKKYN